MANIIAEPSSRWPLFTDSTILISFRLPQFKEELKSGTVPNIRKVRSEVKK